MVNGKSNLLPDTDMIGIDPGRSVAECFEPVPILGIDVFFVGQVLTVEIFKVGRVTAEQIAFLLLFFHGHGDNLGIGFLLSRLISIAFILIR